MTTPQLSDAPYIIDAISQDERNDFEELLTAYLAHNLEHVALVTDHDVQWPLPVRLVIADTLIRGMYKYYPEDVQKRTFRVLLHNTFTSGSTPRDLQAFFEEDDDVSPKNVVLFKAICSALNILYRLEVFSADIHRLHEIRWAALQHEYSNEVDTIADLGSILSIVKDVVYKSALSASDVVDFLLTAITGIPCLVKPMALPELPCFEEIFTTQITVLVNEIVFVVVMNLIEYNNVLCDSPLQRWQLTTLIKIGYLHKQCHKGTQLTANWGMMRLLSKLDVAHAVLETGMAMKPVDRKVMFVAPFTLTTEVTAAIADVYLTSDFMAMVATGASKGRVHLSNIDKETMEATADTHSQYGNWMSLGHHFPRDTLRSLISREKTCRYRVLSSSGGDVLFFVDYFGPWKIKTPDMPEAFHAELMRGCVDGYDKPIRPNALERRLRLRGGHPGQPPRTEQVSLSDENNAAWGRLTTLSTWKPHALDAIINKPGRILVKRKGLIGNMGRVIAAIILALGIVTIIVNVPERENWLERLFDGAQVMSLVAGLAVVVIYVLSGTLTSTLDWLAGVTEVTDEEQLVRATGESLEALQVACSYERGNVYWLSAANSCFCPAQKHGDLIFTGGLSSGALGIKHSLIHDGSHGFWLLQGWAFKLEGNKELGHMEQIPFEDRVYDASDAAVHPVKEFAGESCT